MKNSVTVTMIFEASALNRDEGAGGNIITIKKLTRGNGNDGNVYSFISRPAIRHYLFTTLYRDNPERWKPTPIRRTTGQNKKKVIQLRVLDDNAKKVEHTIIDSAELDVFGYMVTIGKGDNDKGGNLIRKAPLGITKAISLEPWHGDMAMYVNIGLVQRGIKEGKDATPDPYNREEHNSYYKVSFTLDLERLGVDEWYGEKIEKILSEYEFDEANGKIEDIKDKEGKRIGKKIKVDVDETKGRVKDILGAIKNGLTYHVSGENEIIEPKFLIAALVKIPAPVFHYYVEVEDGKISPLTINSALLNEGLKNGWIIKENGKPIVYLYAAPGVKVETGETGLQWEEFLGKVLDEVSKPYEDEASEEKEAEENQIRETTKIRKEKGEPSEDMKAEEEKKGAKLREEGSSVRAYGTPILEYSLEERIFILKKREKSTGKEEEVGTIKEDEDFEKKLKKLHVSRKAGEEFKKLHEKISKKLSQ